MNSLKNVDKWVPLSALKKMNVVQYMGHFIIVELVDVSMMEISSQRYSVGLRSSVMFTKLVWDDLSVVAHYPAGSSQKMGTLLS